ncbi:hypothetical protein BJV74DRAFT_241709 [Russula compacta]|nr:hypothetical protein BJV74DRAFT_241709 [Russula compacta]
MSDHPRYRWTNRLEIRFHVTKHAVRYRSVHQTQSASAISGTAQSRLEADSSLPLPIFFLMKTIGHHRWYTRPVFTARQRRSTS